LTPLSEIRSEYFEKITYIKLPIKLSIFENHRVPGYHQYRYYGISIELDPVTPP
jgi:hypothetical protein